jgi:hypothetical protein
MRGPISLFVIAAALWLSPGIAHAQQPRVTNCNDAGPGSLRAVAESAPSGSIVELRSLPCNQIVLRTGPIRLSQYIIAFQGPGWTQLTVNADSRSQAFVHTPPPPIPFEAPPALLLRGFTISWGRALDANAFGGCIYGGASVSLQDMQVHHCIARDTRPGGDAGYGGAVFALTGVGLTHSRVHTNRAEGGDGGGVWSGGGFGALSNSSVSNNYASGDGGGAVSMTGGRIELSSINHNTAGGFAGGISMGGGLIWIIRSTIANNMAHDSAAGQLLPGSSSRIIQSTISNNIAEESVGGIGFPHENQNREILNSTITQNHALAAGTRGCRGGGVGMGSPVRFNSSIVSGNTCAGAPNDIGLEDSEIGGDSVNGRDNIIGVSTFPLPPDTIITNNPRLGALADNGGPTLTHLPLADSPAIDAGNNLPGFGNDQRGTGFPRTKGAETDIGSVER